METFVEEFVTRSSSLVSKFYHLVLEYEQAYTQTQETKSSIRNLEITVKNLAEDAWVIEKKQLVTESVSGGGGFPLWCQTGR